MCSWSAIKVLAVALPSLYDLQHFAYLLETRITERHLSRYQLGCFVIELLILDELGCFVIELLILDELGCFVIELNPSSPLNNLLRSQGPIFRLSVRFYAIILSYRPSLVGGCTFLVAESKCQVGWYPQVLE